MITFWTWMFFCSCAYISTMWELQALVEFMYRGKVYVQQQQLAKLMQSAEVLQVRGLSTQGNDNCLSSLQQCDSNASVAPSTTAQPEEPDYKKEDSTSDDGTSSTNFLEATSLAAPSTASASAPSHSSTPVSQNPKALSACEVTLTETQGMVKMEPDEQFTQQQQDKPYSISMVPSSNCNPSSPFPAIEGYQRRQRRSEEELKQASDMVARGMTFQVASEKYKIPISTIRFYMVRKGILQRRKRGRGPSNLDMDS